MCMYISMCMCVYIMYIHECEYINICMDGAVWIFFDSAVFVRSRAFLHTWMSYHMNASEYIYTSFVCNYMRGLHRATLFRRRCMCLYIFTCACIIVHMRMYYIHVGIYTDKYLHERAARLLSGSAVYVYTYVYISYARHMCIYLMYVHTHDIHAPIQLHEYMYRPSRARV